VNVDPLAGLPVKACAKTSEIQFGANVSLERYDVGEPDGEQMPLRLLIDRAPVASDSLVVSLHGSVDRQKYSIPRFERVTSFGDVAAHRLFLSDSTLELNPGMRIGWYVGGSGDDLTIRYSDLIREMADRLGASRVLIVGASAGGFGALAMSTYVPGSLALAFSPQTNIGRYSRQWSEFLTRHAFAGYRDYSAVEAQVPYRVDLAALYATRVGGRGWYVQNSGDVVHEADHMEPFRQSVDDRVAFVREYHCEGHNPPTTTRVRAWVEHALTNFDGGPGEMGALN